MDFKQKIVDLIIRLQVLPKFDEGVLRAFTTDLKFTIQEIFDPGSPYLDYLKYIKFTPQVVFVTEKERERSWQDGIAQIDNLLCVILNDHKLNAPVFISGSNRIEPFTTVESPAFIEDGVQQSLKDFKKSVQEEYPAHEEEGPIAEPLRTDSIALASPAAQTEGGQPALNIPQVKERAPNVGFILCVPGSEQAINHEVMIFLEDLPAKVMLIPKAVGQESLIDRLKHCLKAQFVVFILSADFHVYSRTQNPVDASFAASQEAVFELGYFAAKFDRQNIVVLYLEHADFLRPTEFFDLFYVPITPSGEWKREIIRRMKGRLAIPAGLGLSLEKQSGVQVSP